jgi:hypothetical protein
MDMTGMHGTWHLDDGVLDRYLAGGLPEPVTASVEAHLLACADCRAALAGAAGTPVDTHRRTWAALEAAVDDEPAGAWERLLRGVPSHVVRLVAAAPALRRAWWAAGAALLVLALLAANLGSGELGTALFVVTAPLVPLAGVALAYSASDDLAGEVALTTPYSRFRLLLLRTGAVAATTLPVTGVLAAALPVDTRLATLWLAPAVALCALSLLLSARWDTRRVAAVLAGLWIAGSGITLRPTTAALAVEELLDRSALFRPAGQGALLLVAVLALAVAVARRGAFENRRTA